MQAPNPDLTENRERAQATADQVAARLDMIAEETERGWSGHVTTEGGLRFERMVRGVKEAAVLDVALIGSADARYIDQMTTRLNEIYSAPRPSFPEGQGAGNFRSSFIAGHYLCGRPQGSFHCSATKALEK